MADPITAGLLIGGALLSNDAEKDRTRAERNAAYTNFESSFDEIKRYIDQRDRLKEIYDARKSIVTDKYGLQINDVIKKFDDYSREYTSNLEETTISGQNSMARTGLSKSGTVSSGLDRIRKKLERGYTSTRAQTGRDVAGLEFGKKESIANLDIQRGEQEADLMSQIYRLQGNAKEMIAQMFSGNKYTEKIGDQYQSAYDDFIDSLNL